jgi:type I restriction enzyme S subunit
MNIFSNYEINVNVDDRVLIKEDEKQNIVEYGDIIFTGSSESLFESGMSSVLTVKTEEKLYLNSFCFGFRLNDGGMMLPEFSKHLFRSPSVRKQIVRLANGVTRFNLSRGKMESISIPLPPLPIQEEIVRILDNFTELTAELTARKKQFEYYRDKLLTFGDEVEWKTLGDIGPVRMCKRIMKAETSSFGDVPFYKIGTFGKEPDAFITFKKFNEYKEAFSFPKKGDILISASGTIGRTVIYDGEPAYFQDSNIVWIDNDEGQVLNKFLFYWYSTEPWSIPVGGTIARLYNNLLMKTRVPVLPIREQERIVSILDKFNALVNDISIELPAEIEARQKQYEYYRERLLSFKELDPLGA